MFSKMCTTLYIPNSNVQITHFLTYRCYFLTFKYNFSAYEAVSLRDFNLHLLDGWQCWTFLLVAIGWVLFVLHVYYLGSFHPFASLQGVVQDNKLHHYTLLRPLHTLTMPSYHWVVAVLYIFQIWVRLSKFSFFLRIELSPDHIFWSTKDFNYDKIQFIFLILIVPWLHFYETILSFKVMKTHFSALFKVLSFTVTEV